MQRLGILGGTFDPIHYGHLRIAETARESLQLEQVVFVPNGVPAHKDARGVSSIAARLEMVRLAIASNPAFACSAIETERAGPSYAIDTVRAFRRQYPHLEALFWIVGADTVPQIPTWHDAGALVQECRFAAVTRPGTNEAEALLPPGFAPPDCVTTLRAPGLEIAATALREAVRLGHSIKYLVPEAVEASVRRRGLYRSAPRM